MKKLVLFTTIFPYGKGEAFIESEIPELAKKFDLIYIIPSIKVEGKRELPSNVKTLDIVVHRNREVSFRNILNLFPKLLTVFLYSLCYSSKRLNYLRFWKSFVGYAIDDLSKQGCIERIISEKDLSQAVFYDYWFVNSTLTLANLKRKGLIMKALARCHRFDLYDEIQFEGVVSFREYKAQFLNMIIPICLHGEHYLKNCLTSKHHHKINYSYLGVAKSNLASPKKVQPVYTIVSCSRIVNHKKVGDIVEVLSRLQHEILWIHFGSGPQFEDVIERCSSLPPNIKYELMGEVNNTTVLEYYASNYIDLFITLSESEGLPVSIMEAMMYGIPIVGKSLYGIPEIVADGCGILVESGVSIECIASTVDKALNLNFNRDYIKRTCEQNFDAQLNFKRFANILSEMK